MHIIDMTGVGSVLVAFVGWSKTFAMWQTPDMINTGNAKLLEIFVIVAALSLFAVAVVVVGLAVVAVKAKNEIMKHVVEIKAKVMPLIEKSHGLVNDLTPEIKQITTKVHEITSKVNEITGHVGEIVVVAKEKVNEFSPTISQANVTISEALGKAKETFGEANQTVLTANQKTRQQVDRINGMVTGVLDATVKMGKAVEHGISLPGRELAGLISGAKTSFESLLGKAKGFGFGGKTKPVTPRPYAGASSASGYAVIAKTAPPLHSQGITGIDTEEAGV